MEGGGGRGGLPRLRDALWQCCARGWGVRKKGM
jgi:hypothetical protein